MTPLHSLPTIRRPRERLLQHGVSTLELEELIAVLLRTGSAQQDVLVLAQKVAMVLLSGSVSIESLAALPGVGRIKASEIIAALELKDALNQRCLHQKLEDPEAVYRNCADLYDKPQEHLVVFYLTVRNQQITRETISVGTATASLAHPREVFRPAIAHNAAHIVLAHNHPSNIASPSEADLEITRRIAVAGALLGIELVDHVICCSSGYLSLRVAAPKVFTVAPEGNFC